MQAANESTRRKITPVSDHQSNQTKGLKTKQLPPTCHLTRHKASEKTSPPTNQQQVNYKSNNQATNLPTNLATH
jgi:hypothetical protein